MPMLAEAFDAVIGADTHRDTHTLALTTPTGVPIADITITDSPTGYAHALVWIAEQAPGPKVLAGLEGTRSYGIGLTRALTAAGHTVVEVERPRRQQRRQRGKSDPIDARLAARKVLDMDATTVAVPRSDGPREALRILLVARRGITGGRTADINQLRALLRGGDDTDRDLARQPTYSSALLQQIIRRRGSTTADIAARTLRQEARRLATAITQADTQLADNLATLSSIVTDLHPTLLTKRGVGPVSAAQAIISFSHPGRCRNDSAFAALAGASPLPASSGRTVRHRLNRGGDRQLNRALHTIALSRWATCPRTAQYIAKRTAQGHNPREIRRALKRYIARELFKTLNTPTP